LPDRRRSVHARTPRQGGALVSVLVQKWAPAAMA